MAASLASIVGSVSEQSGLIVNPDAISAIVYLANPLSNRLRNATRNTITRSLPGEMAKRAMNDIITNKNSAINSIIYDILVAANVMNNRRNTIMRTNDGIDSYDIFRGIIYNEELSRLFTSPQFPYQVDPDPTIRPLPSLTLGAKAGLSSYYKAFSENVKRLSTEEVNREMTVMGLTPNARLDLSRQLLISEVDRRINQEIISFPKVDFLDLLNILARIVQRYKSH